MPEEKELSRRRFLQYGGLMAGAAATLGVVRVSVAAEPDAPAAHGDAGAPLNRGWMFFANPQEFATLADAAERIFPQDESGPSAKALAVPFFIDNQLAGAYGYQTREYTDGPYYPGAPTQGPQSALLRRDVFKQGLSALNAAARERHGKDFTQLDGAEQDRILADCETDKLSTRGFASSYFFGLLRGAVLAGAYADPLYNGNNDMNGWRMKEYPGAQMSYAYLISDEGFEKMDPVSLSSMQ